MAGMGGNQQHEQKASECAAGKSVPGRGCAQRVETMWEDSSQCTDRAYVAC